jgi:hypothetical protein
MPSCATSTAFSVEYRIAPAQSWHAHQPGVPAIHARRRARTRRLIFPASHARATAYTYERLAFMLVYMSAILPARGRQCGARGEVEQEGRADLA